MKANYVNCLLEYCSDVDLVETCWQQVMDAYSAPQRFYHNLEHLQNFSNKLDFCKNKLKDYPSFFLAMIYHDIVYFMKDGSNETKSAEVAAVHLKKLGYPVEGIDHIVQLIEATKTHAASMNADVNYFLDADMSILGSDAAYYDQYAINIWKEYELSPQFPQGRKRVLQHFLAMDRIFKTDLFFQRYEQNARRNIERKIGKLANINCW
ncbi:HD domain-containing protein [Sphingobacterium sp. LRF_L2]|uniref:HD domain-containing protein n=1 Tax=Sphingobacterium sp. LRF_L2 TaxID=3369421 RepID=UPI003F60FA9E